MNRRAFSKTALGGSLGLGLIPDSLFSNPLIAKGAASDLKDYLSKLLYTKKEVDDWFAGKAFPFAKYHGEFGWLLNDARFADGVNDSYSVYTYAKNNGERIMSNYKEKSCRINTYGNSFTQCHQVSDHETWQEILAAHLQEPVRNFGIGGWSVYQAYLRMLKEEKEKPADYIIFNIYEDDSNRNLDAWRNFRVNKHPNFIEPTLPYCKVNLKNQLLTEHKNPCPTPESVYNLCSLDKTYEIFKDDFVLHTMWAHENSKDENASLKYKEIMDLTQTHGIETQLDTNSTVSEIAAEYHKRCALLSTKKIIEKINEYCAANDKKLLYVVSYPAKYIAQSYTSKSRWDQELIDYISEKELPCIDLYEAHINEFDQNNIELTDYLKKYFIGHYNPRGNFFCADAIRDKLIHSLDPKPIPYTNNK